MRFQINNGKMYFQYLYGRKIVGLWQERRCLEAEAQEGESCAGGQRWALLCAPSGGVPIPLPTQLRSSAQLLLLHRDGVCLGLLPSERRVIDKLCDGQLRLSQLHGELLCRGSWLDG